MRKIMLLASVLALLGVSPTFASDCGCMAPAKPCDKETVCKEIVKDNKCFFDKEYKKMKGQLGLDCAQETKIDCYYKDFKNKMNALSRQYHHEQKSLCKMISNDGCKSEIKAKKKELKEIKKYMKNECKSFQESVKCELCKNQKKEFRKFIRAEKRKMKQLGKNCNVLRLPCLDNCHKKPACETYKKPDCGCEKPKYNCEENKCKDDCNKAKCPSECNKPKCKSGYEAKKYYNYNSCDKCKQPKTKCNCK